MNGYIKGLCSIWNNIFIFSPFTIYLALGNLIHYDGFQSHIHDDDGVPNVGLSFVL